MIGVTATALLSLVLFRTTNGGKAHDNPPDPHTTRAGDMSVAWQMREFDRLHLALQQIGEKIDNLGRRLSS